MISRFFQTAVAASVAVLIADQAFAQTVAASVAPALTPVVITPTRSPLRSDQSVADVTVLDRADIEQATGRTLAEFLAQQAGIQMQSQGGLGQLSAVSLRGLASRHTLLLVDGVRYGSATAGQPVLDNLPLGEVERIEIVRGPLAGLYGSDAVGGVIHVFTRRATEGQRFNAALTAGSNGYAQAQGGVSFADALWSGSLQLSRTQTDGFSATNAQEPFGNFNPDRDGFRQNAGSLNLGLKLPADWQTNLHLLHADARSAYDDGLGVDSMAGLQTQVAALETSGRVMAGWRTTVRVARSRDVYDTLVSASPWSDLGPISSDQEQLSWENTVTTPVGSLLVLGEHLRQNVSKPVQAYEVSQRTVKSAALGLNGEAGAHTWQLSWRRDANSQYGQQSNGSLGYGYQFHPVWRITAAAGSSFVAPSFNSLYWPGFSNPLLEPEQGEHREVGLRYSRGVHQWHATLFTNRIRGYITQGAQPVNLPYTHSNGLSWSYDAQLDALKLSTSFDHLDARNDTVGAQQDKLLPRVAPNSAKLAANWRLNTAWTAGMTMQAYSERFDDAANTVRLAGFGTVDLQAQWALKPDWSVQTRLNNLADKPYQTALGYNQPGREVYVSLRYAPR
ncbi:MAG: TonB-dependent receptor [Leptothrix ochracea]|uniref:TonB-dependent receptor domain-containing protein n=1 Tax=Leptothrix ochracea TaxID=735331 RepID=UPI0034E2CBD8